MMLFFELWRCAGNGRIDTDNLNKFRPPFLLKFGISGTALNKNGASARANSQVNKLNEAAGKALYKALVIKTNDPGRAAALAMEKSFVYGYKNATGRKPIGNVRP